MSYTRDKDMMIRGVGAIASVDAGNVRRARARARARAAMLKIDARHAQLAHGPGRKLPVPLSGMPDGTCRLSVDTVRRPNGQVEKVSYKEAQQYPYCTATLGTNPLAPQPTQPTQPRFGRAGAMTTRPMISSGYSSGGGVIPTGTSQPPGPLTPTSGGGGTQPLPPAPLPPPSTPKGPTNASTGVSTINPSSSTSVYLPPFQPVVSTAPPPEMPPDMPDDMPASSSSSGMSTGKKVAIGLGALGLLYLLTRND